MRGILNTLACNVYVRLKTTSIVIKIATSNKQSMKLIQFGETCTETIIFIHEYKYGE